MDKRFAAILVAIVVIFIGVFAVTQHSSSPASSNAQPTKHIEGQGASGVTLIEYGDYECPFCRGYAPIVDQVVAQFGSKIHFQFRNLPLSQIHRNALSSARAAEAASEQGKFWQMHDLLYENQDPYGQTGWVASSNPLADYFVGYAKQLGLNISKFKSDFGSSQTNDKINADINAFLDTSYANHDTGKESTPSFFLDGKFISDQTLGVPVAGSPYSYDLDKSVANFAKLINAEITNKTHK